MFDPVFERQKEGLDDEALGRRELHLLLRIRLSNQQLHFDRVPVVSDGLPCHLVAVLEPLKANSHTVFQFRHFQKIASLEIKS